MTLVLQRRFATRDGDDDIATPTRRRVCCRTWAYSDVGDDDVDASASCVVALYKLLPSTTTTAVAHDAHDAHGDDDDGVYEWELTYLPTATAITTAASQPCCTRWRVRDATTAAAASPVTASVLAGYSGVVFLSARVVLLYTGAVHRHTGHVALDCFVLAHDKTTAAAATTARSARLQQQQQQDDDDCAHGAAWHRLAAAVPLPDLAPRRATSSPATHAHEEQQQRQHVVRELLHVSAVSLTRTSVVQVMYVVCSDATRTQDDNDDDDVVDVTLGVVEVCVPTQPNVLVASAVAAAATTTTGDTDTTASLLSTRLRHLCVDRNVSLHRLLATSTTTTAATASSSASRTTPAAAAVHTRVALRRCLWAYVPYTNVGMSRPPRPCDETNASTVAWQQQQQQHVTTTAAADACVSVAGTLLCIAPSSSLLPCYADDDNDDDDDDDDDVRRRRACGVVLPRLRGGVHDTSTDGCVAVVVAVDTSRSATTTTTHDALCSSSSSSSDDEDDDAGDASRACVATTTPPALALLSVTLPLRATTTTTTTTATTHDVAAAHVTSAAPHGDVTVLCFVNDYTAIPSQATATTTTTSSDNKDDDDDTHSNTAAPRAAHARACALPRVGLHVCATSWLPRDSALLHAHMTTPSYASSLLLQQQLLLSSSSLLQPSCCCGGHAQTSAHRRTTAAAALHVVSPATPCVRVRARRDALYCHAVFATPTPSSSSSSRERHYTLYRVFVPQTPSPTSSAQYAAVTTTATTTRDDDTLVARVCHDLAYTDGVVCEAGSTRVQAASPSSLGAPRALIDVAERLASAAVCDDDDDDGDDDDDHDDDVTLCKDAWWRAGCVLHRLWRVCEQYMRHCDDVRTASSPLSSSLLSSLVTQHTLSSRQGVATRFVDYARSIATLYAAAVAATTTASSSSSTDNGVTTTTAMATTHAQPLAQWASMWHAAWLALLTHSDWLAATTTARRTLRCLLLLYIGADIPTPCRVAYATTHAATTSSRNDDKEHDDHDNNDDDDAQRLPSRAELTCMHVLRVLASSHGHGVNNDGEKAARWRQRMLFLYACQRRNAALSLLVHDLVAASASNDDNDDGIERTLLSALGEAPLCSSLDCLAASTTATRAYDRDDTRSRRASDDNDDDDNERNSGLLTLCDVYDTLCWHVPPDTPRTAALRTLLHLSCVVDVAMQLAHAASTPDDNDNNDDADAVVSARPSMHDTGAVVARVVAHWQHMAVSSRVQQHDDSNDEQQHTLQVLLLPTVWLREGLRCTTLQRRAPWRLLSAAHALQTLDNMTRPAHDTYTYNNNNNDDDEDDDDVRTCASASRHALWRRQRQLLHAGVCVLRWAAGCVTHGSDRSARAAADDATSARLLLRALCARDVCITDAACLLDLRMPRYIAACARRHTHKRDDDNDDDDDDNACDAVVRVRACSMTPMQRTLLRVLHAVWSHARSDALPHLVMRAAATTAATTATPRTHDHVRDVVSRASCTHDCASCAHRLLVTWECVVYVQHAARRDGNALVDKLRDRVACAAHDARAGHDTHTTADAYAAALLLLAMLRPLCLYVYPRLQQQQRHVHTRRPHSATRLDADEGSSIIVAHSRVTTRSRATHHALAQLHHTLLQVLARVRERHAAAACLLQLLQLQQSHPTRPHARRRKQASMAQSRSSGCNNTTATTSRSASVRVGVADTSATAAAQRSVADTRPHAFDVQDSDATTTRTSQHGGSRHRVVGASTTSDNDDDDDDDDGSNNFCLPVDVSYLVAMTACASPPQTTPPCAHDVGGRAHTATRLLTTLAIMRPHLRQHVLRYMRRSGVVRTSNNDDDDEQQQQHDDARAALRTTHRYAPANVLNALAESMDAVLTTLRATVAPLYEYATILLLLDVVRGLHMLPAALVEAAARDHGNDDVAAESHTASVTATASSSVRIVAPRSLLQELHACLRSIAQRTSAALSRDERAVVACAFAGDMTDSYLASSSSAGESRLSYSHAIAHVHVMSHVLPAVQASSAAVLQHDDETHGVSASVLTALPYRSAYVAQMRHACADADVTASRDERAAVVADDARRALGDVRAAHLAQSLLGRLSEHVAPAPQAAVAAAAAGAQQQQQLSLAQTQAYASLVRRATSWGGRVVAAGGAAAAAAADAHASCPSPRAQATPGVALLAAEEHLRRHELQQSLWAHDRAFRRSRAFVDAAAALYVSLRSAWRMQCLEAYAQEQKDLAYTFTVLLQRGMLHAHRTALARSRAARDARLWQALTQLAHAERDERARLEAAGAVSQHALRAFVARALDVCATEAQTRSALAMLEAHSWTWLCECAAEAGLVAAAACTEQRSTAARMRADVHGGDALASTKHDDSAAARRVVAAPVDQLASSTSSSSGPSVWSVLSHLHGRLRDTVAPPPASSQHASPPQQPQPPPSRPTAPLVPMHATAQHSMSATQPRSASGTSEQTSTPWQAPQAGETHDATLVSLRRTVTRRDALATATPRPRQARRAPLAVALHTTPPAAVSVATAQQAAAVPHTPPVVIQDNEVAVHHAICGDARSREDAMAADRNEAHNATAAAVNGLCADERRTRHALLTDEVTLRCRLRRGYTLQLL